MNVPVTIQITRRAMHMPLQTQDFKKELIMGFEVISKHLGKGLIKPEEAKIEVATLVFRDIEQIMKGNMIYYSETATNATYCAPTRRPILTEFGTALMENKCRQPDMDGSYIVSKSPMKKAMTKPHEMYKQGCGPLHIDRQRAEDTIHFRDEDSGTEEQKKVKEESKRPEEAERLGKHREENTSRQFKIGIGGKVIVISNEYGPELDARNVIRWMEETQRDKSKATEEVQDDENVTDGWGIINMSKAKASLAESISKADPHMLDAKG